jgi:hypothetical protein
MPIKRVRIDPEKLGLSQNPEVDRRQLIEQSQWSAGAKIDAARSADATHGYGAKQIAQKIKQRGLTLDMNDLMGIPSRGPQLSRSDLFQGMDMGGMMPPGRQMLTEDFPTNHDNMIMDENYEDYRSDYDQPIQRQPVQSRALPQARPQPRPQPQQARPQQPQRQTLRETIMGAPPKGETAMRAPPTQPVQAKSGPPWGVKAYLGETRGGSQVYIWKVVNAKTGTEIQTMFRVESVAARVAAILNESGDSNDPRALSLINLYNKRDSLLKEARALEKTSNGKSMKLARLSTIRSEINQLDYRLGI